jgi:hypothetical protein
MDMNTFLENRHKTPPEQLAPYIGMYVAWSPDGTRIIASAKDELRLDAAIRAAGYDPAEIVVSSIPDEDVILGGGASDSTRPYRRG